MPFHPRVSARSAGSSKAAGAESWGVRESRPSSRSSMCRSRYDRDGSFERHDPLAVVFGLDRDFNGLRPQGGMAGLYDNSAGTVPNGLDPDGAYASAVGERKRVVAHHYSRSRQLESDFSAGELPFRTEFVHHFEDQPGGVGPVAHQFHV